MRGNTGYLPKHARTALDRKNDLAAFLPSRAGERMGAGDVDALATRFDVKPAVVTDVLRLFGRIA